MDRKKNKELIFQENLSKLVDDYGIGNQEGVKACLIECQKIFNFVSISHQQQIAKAFQIDEKIIRVIISYMPSIKESIVEYEVICCSGPRCAKNGSFEVLKAVKDIVNIDFGETSMDGKIRLSTQNCLKKCNFGPNIMVNGKLYNKMNKMKSIELMKGIK